MDKIKGWKAAILAWFGSLVIVGNEAIAYLDDDPATLFSKEAFLLGLTGIGLGFVVKWIAGAAGKGPRKLIVLLAACVILCGCSLWPAKAAAEANFTYWKTVEPRYRKYLADDELLNDKQRKILNDTVDGALDLARDMVKEAK